MPQTLPSMELRSCNATLKGSKEGCLLVQRRWTRRRVASQMQKKKSTVPAYLESPETARGVSCASTPRQINSAKEE